MFEKLHFLTRCATLQREKPTAAELAMKKQEEQTKKENEKRVAAAVAANAAAAASMAIGAAPGRSRYKYRTVCLNLCRVHVSFMSSCVWGKWDRSSTTPQKDMSSA